MHAAFDSLSPTLAAAIEDVVVGPARHAATVGDDEITAGTARELATGSATSSTGTCMPG